MNGEPELLEALESGVLWLTLNRPDKLNALSPSLKTSLAAALRRAATDDAVRLVVLTGAGRGFCAGGDRVAAPAIDPAVSQIDRIEAKAAEMLLAADTASLLHEMPKPTIAMINGPCAGAGLSLAGACDLRIAGSSAMLTSAFIKIGLSGDFGGTWFWSRILGAAKARRLYLLSEKFDANDALAFGLVDFVFLDTELKARTEEIARDLAGKSPRGLRLLKQNLNAAEDDTRKSVLNIEALNMALADAKGDAVFRKV